MTIRSRLEIAGLLIAASALHAFSLITDRIARLGEPSFGGVAGIDADHYRTKETVRDVH